MGAGVAVGKGVAVGAGVGGGANTTAGGSGRLSSHSAPPAINSAVVNPRK
jgi:hypothetical protein